MKHFKNHYGQSRIFGRKMNLQLFAEGGEGGEGAEGKEGKEGAEGQEGKEGAGNGGEGGEEKKFTQAQVDEMVKARLAREKEAQEKALEEAKAEAAKLAKMNEQQKQQYELEKQQKANEDLKAEIEQLKKAQVRIELGKTATNLLREKNIDATEDILDFVVGADAESTKTNIDRFVKIVEEQVKKAEVARATGTTPRTYNNNGAQMSEIDKRIAKYQ